MAKRYEGRCHCGAVQFVFYGPEFNSGLRCTCSMCSRKGAMMSPFTISPDDLEIQAEDDAISLYQFGTKKAKHFFCKRCGIYPFHETARMPGFYRVNLGCVEGVDIFSLDEEVFDGRNLL